MIVTLVWHTATKIFRLELKMFLYLQEEFRTEYEKLV